MNSASRALRGDALSKSRAFREGSENPWIFVTPSGDAAQSKAEAKGEKLATRSVAEFSSKPRTLFLFIYPKNPQIMAYKLVCFDVDGTLIENVKFSWQLFHDHFRIEPSKREAGKRAFMKGDISYLQWAEHDVGLWKERKATKQDFFDAIDANKVILIPGVRETLDELRSNGMKLAVISGSVNVMLERFIPDFEDVFDDVYLSRLLFDDAGIICGVNATQYDIEHKATALKLIAKRENISLSETVFIGDYLNDLHALQVAGLGIAFNSKMKEVKDAADISIDTKDMRDILPHILGK